MIDYTCDECGGAMVFAMHDTAAHRSYYLCENRGEDWHSTPSLDDFEPRSLEDIVGDVVERMGLGDDET